MAFNWFISAQSPRRRGGHWRLADAAAADLRLREDLRSRLAGAMCSNCCLWTTPSGAVLRRAADQRGITLSDEGDGFHAEPLLARPQQPDAAARDAFDGYALRAQRAITIP